MSGSHEILTKENHNIKKPYTKPDINATLNSIQQTAIATAIEIRIEDAVQHGSTWLYSKHVSNNIGKTFIHLINKQFPKAHPLHKICNRSTIKVSYSCMNNMGTIVISHNNITRANKPQQEDNSNCRNNTDCPLPGKCTT